MCVCIYRYLCVFMWLRVFIYFVCVCVCTTCVRFSKEPWEVAAKQNAAKESDAYELLDDLIDLRTGT